MDVRRQAFDDLRDIPRGGATPSRIVWHYTNRDGLEGILRSNTIRAADATTMNDPRELNHGHQIIVDALDRAALPAERKAAVQRQLDFAHQELTHGKTFVVSASSDGDRLPQWIAYGGCKGDVSGYALGFRVPGEALNLLERRPFDHSTDENQYGDIYQQVSVWRDVLYDNVAKASEADHFIDVLARAVDPSSFDPALSTYDFNELMVRPFAYPAYAGLVTRFKGEPWRFEDEVRLTAAAMDADRFHTTPTTGRTYVEVTGWTRPSAISGTSTYASSIAAPLPLLAVRSGPLCRHSDLRELLDVTGYTSTQDLSSEIDYR